MLLVYSLNLDLYFCRLYLRFKDHKSDVNMWRLTCWTKCDKYQQLPLLLVQKDIITAPLSITNHIPIHTKVPNVTSCFPSNSFSPITLSLTWRLSCCDAFSKKGWGTFWESQSCTAGVDVWMGYGGRVRPHTESPQPHLILFCWIIPSRGLTATLQYNISWESKLCWWHADTRKDLVRLHWSYLS